MADAGEIHFTLPDEAFGNNDEINVTGASVKSGMIYALHWHKLSSFFHEMTECVEWDIKLGILTTTSSHFLFCFCIFF